MDPSKALIQFALHELPSLLEQMLRSPGTLSEVAARSYTHDNGFTKIVLVRAADGTNALRLHVWIPASSDDSRGNIHNHCWDFSSLVLSGGLEYEEFEEDDDGVIAAKHCLYDPSNDFEYALRALGTKKLRRIKAGIHKAGETYYLPAEKLHRTWRQNATTVTLLSQGAHRRKCADVYITSDVSPAAEMKNEPLQPEALRLMIVKIQSLLSATHF